MPKPIRPSQLAGLLMQHRTSLYAYIFSCVRNHADAEDILQNVSVAAMESYRQLQSQEGFLPWAREIARRRVLAHHRQSHRQQPFDPELVQVLSEAAERVEEAEPASDHHVALLSCLEGLPPESRKLISARYRERGGDANELANRFGHSVQSIYARIKRIKLALRHCVEKKLAREL